MRVIVYPDQASVSPVLNGYVISAPWTNIPGAPSFQVNCGEVWFGSSHYTNFVVGQSGYIYCGIDEHKIIRFMPPLAPGKQVEVLYQHHTWIRRLALRTVAGTERLYFSAESPTPQDNNREQIFWLDNKGVAHPYWAVGKNDLQVPDPCHPGQNKYIPLFYSGEFTFGDNDTLFLSNGNSLPCSIFRVSNALPESVSGKPQRLFSTDAYSISDLQHDGQGGLLFSDYCTDEINHTPYRIFRFDLATQNVKVVLNPQGIPFRGFALSPSTKKTLHRKFRSSDVVFEKLTQLKVPQN